MSTRILVSGLVLTVSLGAMAFSQLPGKRGGAPNVTQLVLYLPMDQVHAQQQAAGGAGSLHYTIKVSKDHEQVTATWDLSVNVSNTEVISDFTLTVEGQALNTQCWGGNKACKGADYLTLSNPTANCPVTFIITTNQPDVRKGSDDLRGQKALDDVDFYH